MIFASIRFGHIPLPSICFLIRLNWYTRKNHVLGDLIDKTKLGKELPNFATSQAEVSARNCPGPEADPSGLVSDHRRTRTHIQAVERA